MLVFFSSTSIPVYAVMRMAPVISDSDFRDLQSTFRTAMNHKDAPAPAKWEREPIWHDHRRVTIFNIPALMDTENGLLTQYTNMAVVASRTAREHLSIGSEAASGGAAIISACMEHQPSAIGFVNTIGIHDESMRRSFLEGFCENFLPDVILVVYVW